MIDAEVSSKVAVQDAEVSTFYQQNLERFKQGDSVHASHILFGVAQGATAGTEDRSEGQGAGGAEAGQRRRRLRDHRQSGVAGSRRSAPNGGDLGFFRRADEPAVRGTRRSELKTGTVSRSSRPRSGFTSSRCTSGARRARRR
jgi:hypothetical protein